MMQVIRVGGRTFEVARDAVTPPHLLLLFMELFPDHPDALNTRLYVEGYDERDVTLLLVCRHWEDASYTFNLYRFAKLLEEYFITLEGMDYYVDVEVAYLDADAEAIALRVTTDADAFHMAERKWIEEWRYLARLFRVGGSAEVQAGDNSP